MQDQPWHFGKRLLLPKTRREDLMEKLTSERDRERRLVSRGTKKKRSRKWNTQKRNGGTKIGSVGGVRIGSGG